ncbi:cell division protein FtsZ [Qipengyuania sp. XHP0207]|uniref:cell division protein FtsZ n=1 Tax=Qipengyuania sp. XHP0207 TaxID=3038078 RepID=UPI00241FC924|nr:cell division protein FtsZ [Qipengyuania sp. XHP0207]MDG5748965.1 cell division protein FtsZ [Qipengyuania sp. XHP0207]
MSINIGPASSDDLRPKIMVIGVGGAGGNAIANMMEAGIEGVDFIVSNTDAQALSTSPAETRIQLGPDITGGLGAGARPEVGKAAAEETVEDIEDALEGCNMVFIAAGMGGGTGTGAAPVIAEAARKKGVLTVGVVTKPFLFEGTRRMRAAEAGIDELQKHVDTLIVIPNQNLFLVAKAETTFKEAFQLADEVLQQGVRSITDLMVMPGLINLDFADVRSVMQEMGKAMMGTGEGEGDNRALEAAERAIANPLLDGVSMTGAKGVIISILGGEDMKLLEVDEAANHIRELVDEDANIIWGSAFNPDLEGKIRVSVVATGIETDGSAHSSAPQNFSMSDSRAPKRPVLDLPSDEVDEDEPFELSEGLSAEREDETADTLDLTAEADDDASSVLSDDLGYGSDEDEDEDYDDVDGIVDPLAGLRNEDGEVPSPADDSEFGGGWAEDAGQPSPLDLSEPVEDDDDAGFGASESPLASKPGKKRPVLGGGDGDIDGGAPGDASQGSTLFERMANLSRGANKPSDEEDDEDEDGDEGGSLNIPRFLGRQNNQ